MTTKQTLWIDWWGRLLPSDLSYPFKEYDGKLFGSEGEVHGHPMEPSYRVIDVARESFRYGARLVKKWDVPWGMAVALSLPGTDTAWFLVDDFDRGRFASIGVKIINGIAFGDDISVFHGDVEQAARFAFANGIRRETKAMIEKSLYLNPNFPINQKTRRLWGHCIDHLENKTLCDGLLYLQNSQELTPLTVKAATKTVEITNEYNC